MIFLNLNVSAKDPITNVFDIERAPEKAGAKAAAPAIRAIKITKMERNMVANLMIYYDYILILVGNKFLPKGILRLHTQHQHVIIFCYHKFFVLAEK